MTSFCPQKPYTHADRDPDQETTTPHLSLDLFLPGLLFLHQTIRLTWMSALILCSLRLILMLLTHLFCLWAMLTPRKRPTVMSTLQIEAALPLLFHTPKNFSDTWLNPEHSFCHAQHPRLSHHHRLPSREGVFGKWIERNWAPNRLMLLWTLSCLINVSSYF